MEEEGRYCNREFQAEESGIKKLAKRIRKGRRDEETEGKKWKGLDQTASLYVQGRECKKKTAGSSWIQMLLPVFKGPSCSYFSVFLSVWHQKVLPIRICCFAVTGHAHLII